MALAFSPKRKVVQRATVEADKGFAGAVGDKEIIIEGNYRHTSNYPVTDYLH